MSMRPGREQEIPVITVTVSRVAFFKGCLVMRVLEALGLVFADEAFVDLFRVRSRPALSPARLAVVSALQYVEDLTGCARSRLD